MYAYSVLSCTMPVMSNANVPSCHIDFFFLSFQLPIDLTYSSCFSILKKCNESVDCLCQWCLGPTPWFLDACPVPVLLFGSTHSSLSVKIFCSLDTHLPFRCPGQLHDRLLCTTADTYNHFSSWAGFSEDTLITLFICPKHSQYVFYRTALATNVSPRKIGLCSFLTSGLHRA